MKQLDIGRYTKIKIAFLVFMLLPILFRKELYNFGILAVKHIRFLKQINLRVYLFSTWCGNKKRYVLKQNLSYRFVYGRMIFCYHQELTRSWRRSLSYRNQSIDLQNRSMDWFLYDRGLRHKRVTGLISAVSKRIIGVNSDISQSL